VSGDVHVHMNYGGAYRNAPAHLVFQASAENLPIVQDLVVNKNKRIPDIVYFRQRRTPLQPRAICASWAEFHTSYWGHLGLSSFDQKFSASDYVAYAIQRRQLFPRTRACDLAHEQQGLVGYGSSLRYVPDPAKDALTTNCGGCGPGAKLTTSKCSGFADHNRRRRSGISC